MNFKTFLFTAAAAATLLTSCKKDENNNNGGGANAAPSASTMTAGTGYISFNTDKSFNGGTSHTFRSQPPSENAIAKLSGGTAVIQAVTVATSGANIGKTSTASIQIYNAAVGKVDFVNTGAVFVIATSQGGAVSEGYAMTSGSVEITKFANNEMEGKFSGKAENDDQNTSINITNGTFSAKF